MNWLYQFGIAAYSAGVRLASIRHVKARKMIAGQRETLGRLAELDRDKGTGERIWIHVASLGEFEQGRPLIEKLRAERPHMTIVLSFFSPSGMEVRHDYDKVDKVVYLPFDRKKDVRRFLDALRPSMAIFIKYEFWGNYLSELKRRGIPTYLISGIFRPNQQFFRPWGGQFRKILKCFTRLYVQNEVSRRLLESIGITSNVVVNGDTRLDRVSQIKEHAVTDPLLDAFAISIGAPANTIVAGSTWPADEEKLFAWLHANPGVHAIVAPHEMDPERLASLTGQMGDGTWLLSRLREHFDATGTLPEGVKHIIIDCFGLLASLYRYGSTAYVGGGFGAGIHNINEAAVYGIPVVFGPNYHKFQEANDLIAKGGAFTIDSASSLADILTRLNTDPAFRTDAGSRAAGYIEASRGATALIFKDLFPPN